MGINERQRTDLPFSAVDAVDDKSGNNCGFMAANARNLTSLLGVITQTSPGSIQSLSGAPLGFPGGAVPVNFTIFGKLGSSQASGQINIGLDTTTNYFLTTSVSSGSGGGIGYLIPRETAQLFTAMANLPVGRQHTLTAYYTETATSTGGGPWYVEIDFYTPSPA